MRDADLPVDVIRKIDAAADEFEQAWAGGQRPAIEDYLERVPLSDRVYLFRELIRLEVQLKSEHDTSVDIAEYRGRFVQYGQTLERLFHSLGLHPSTECMNTEEATRKAAAPPLPVSSPTADSLPQSIGRYRIEKLIGQGGCGRVLLAHDPDLARPIALKLPRPGFATDPVQIDAFLTEARAVASLEHPHIVPVYDFGRTDDGELYVVSKYIAGMTLAERVGRERISVDEALAIVATMADALHCAHRQKLIHRDVKPSNILLDQEGHPYLSDFGLVLTDVNWSSYGSVVGTPAYMSPEQARGESHLVDGRADVFSLGAVLYELLVGERPFAGDDWLDVVDRIARQPVRPLRQLNDQLPVEIERVCLRALEKSVHDRYSTALDFATDLRTCLQEIRARAVATVANPQPVPPAGIVPRGLRSYDAQDAPFFLTLLPGPRDRDGIPDSIRTWKAHLETNPGEPTSRVGLIYGPSGCGKSSFVKAGLIPRLATRILPIYLEASAGDTESRLRRSLGKLVPDAPGDATSHELLSLLRQQLQGTTEKVVLFLDQFEQWLHANDATQVSDLATTLRQCDGIHVQCVLMVRDDFWSAVSRFAKQLDVKLVEGHNSGMIDLFDKRHARHVLTWFGQAFGCLSHDPSEARSPQQHFVEQAVDELAEQNLIVSVRLALFAEMVKDQPWTPETLTVQGGTEGLGVQYLERTFVSRNAPHEHRLHGDAIRRVLQSLIPVGVSDLKRPAVDEHALRQAAGCVEQPERFDTVLRILDRETRLITPVADNAEAAGVSAMGRKYQLTHDYLVQPIRQWLFRQQQATPVGRAHLLLKQRASDWMAQRDRRFLPSLIEYLRIRWWTRPNEWARVEAEMMNAARAMLRLRVSAAALIAMVVIAAGWFIRRNLAEAAAVRANRILQADLNNLPTAIDELANHRGRVEPLLRDALQSGTRGERLRASLALHAVDNSQSEYLFDQLFESRPTEMALVRSAVAPMIPNRREQLWALLRTDPSPQVRLRAAGVLAGSPDVADHQPAEWTPYADLLAHQMVLSMVQDQTETQAWIELLRPIHDALEAPLARLACDTEQSSLVRYWATQVTLAYSSDDPEKLITLACRVDESLFDLAFDAFAMHPQAEEMVAKQLMVHSSNVDRSPRSPEFTIPELGRLATIALRLRMIEPVLSWLSAPELIEIRNETMVHASARGVDGIALGQFYNSDLADEMQGTLLSALGSYPVEVFPETVRQTLVAEILETFEHSKDSGVHGLAEWTLKSWGIDSELASTAARLVDRGVDPDDAWCVTPTGVTLVVLGPAEFRMGSPDDDPEIMMREDLHLQHVGRRYGIASTEVTVEEFEKFIEERYANTFAERYARFAPEPTCPRTHVTWYLAAEYCNWLSEKEHIPPDQWCYVANPSGRFAAKMRPADGFLDRLGYRLPTEAEWEFAARGGEAASRSIGSRVEVLPGFAWFQDNAQNRSHPVGSLRPNQYGLFDTLGNVWEWCHNRLTPYSTTGEVAEDAADLSMVEDSDERASRGGSFVTPARYLRSAVRNPDSPAKFNANWGFRVARTLVPAAAADTP